MLRYTTKSFELNNDDIVWEKFMCFVREIIPYEETEFNKLSQIQKNAVAAFIYSSEVMGDGHIGFFDLYGEYISNAIVITALKEISVSDRYIQIMEKMPEKLIDSSEIYEESDTLFYQYGNEDIIDKIIIYIRQHHLEFFEYIIV